MAASNVSAKSLRASFPSLFQEFLNSYPATSAGQHHIQTYARQRQTGQQNYQEVLAASDRGEDITDLVLLKLIPYTDSANHRESGAWIHIASGISGNIKAKFEGAKSTKPEAWPQVAHAIWQLVRRCYEVPDQFAVACAEFQENPITKGFQAGTITPILNALRPDDFLLINRKSRFVINGLAETNYGQKLKDYAAINAMGKALIQELSEVIQQPDRPNLRDSDLFDLFCHWLVAVKSDSSTATVRHWKIAPGTQAWQWPESCAKGFIGLGWDEMGDVSGLDKSAFANRREAVISANPNLKEGWSEAGLKQLWEFAQIQVGDRIIANQGTQQILGIGTVTRPYYFIPNLRHGHRVDVEWDDLTPRSIKETGWVKTLCQLKPEQFYDLCNAPILNPEATEVADGNSPRIWWVNQSKSLDLEKSEGYITAPVKGQDGRKVSHWDSLQAVKVGDIVLHYSQRSLRYVSRVTAPASIDHNTEGGERRFVRLDYQPLHPPVPAATFIHQLIALNLPESPIQKDGRVRQGYLFPLTETAFTIIRESSPETNWAEINLGWNGHINPPNPKRPAYKPPSFEAIGQHVQTQKLRLADRTLRRYHLALQTRGFVILSGVSGTGKTWLTEVYAEAVGAEYCLVAVAPNWTSNEDLLGYWNPLDGIYHHTAFSRFLAAAAEEYYQAQQENRAAYPYHLVLDEMNLARVEYYFARFLSAMEVRQRHQTAKIDLAPDYQLILPPNLAFIGTVNVDETTHGFADKVYDRAQLIELSIDRPMLATHLGAVPYRDTLLNLWDALHPVAPFAFRVVSEMQTYIAAGEAIEIPWPETLDEQLVQKILPKLKGMDQRVGKALQEFLAITTPDTFPLSHQKAQTMQEMWNQHGIVSYF
jgi:MoxR-like ATPase